MRVFLKYLYKKCKGKCKVILCWAITPQSQAQSTPALVPKANRFEQAMITPGNNRVLVQKILLPFSPHYSSTTLFHCLDVSTL